jgi:hypothetical protein
MGACERVWPWGAIGFAAPLPGRRQGCKIAMPKGRIGRIPGANQRCNWVAARYSPRRFRWPIDCGGAGATRADKSPLDRKHKGPRDVRDARFCPSEPIRR